MSDQDEYQSIPVAEARAAVQASGELEGVEGPLFLAEVGEEWQPFFSKVRFGEDAHPEFAKITVTRKGQKPREFVISWDEYAGQMDSDPEWDAIREKKPMAVFGGECERHAYRVVFADVLAAAMPTRVARSEMPAMPGACGRHPDGAWEPCGACREVRQRAATFKADGNAPGATVWERDWHADLAAASTKAEVDALFEEARAAKALKDAKLHEAFTRRLREVLASPKPTPSPAPNSAPSPAAVAQKAKPLTVQQPRRPQGDRPQGQRRRGKR